MTARRPNLRIAISAASHEANTFIPAKIEDVIVSSFRTQTIDQEIFLLHGIDGSHTKIVALRSSDHFRAAFRPISAAIIGCHTRGLVSADLTTFDYRRLERPIWPLDRDITWSPNASDGAGQMPRG